MKSGALACVGGRGWAWAAGFGLAERGVPAGQRGGAEGAAVSQTERLQQSACLQIRG